MRVEESQPCVVFLQVIHWIEKAERWGNVRKESIWRTIVVNVRRGEWERQIRRKGDRYGSKVSNVCEHGTKKECVCKVVIEWETFQHWKKSVNSMQRGNRR